MLAVKIAGMGRYLPARVVPSSTLEDLCGLPAGWVERYNGVRERRWATDETASYMAAEAAQEALDRAGMTADELDLILNATGTQEQAIPDNGPLIQRQLGLPESGLPCYSVHATCLSFVAALQVAGALVTSGQYRKILITSSEITSCAVNTDEPESASLLGDAAAAAVLIPTPPDDPATIEAIRIETYGEGAFLTAVHGGGTRQHPNREGATREENLFTMNGPQILRRARKYSPAFLEALRPGLSTSMANVDLIVPHQASLMGLRLLGHFGWEPAHIVQTLSWMGNCVAASIPATLYEAIQTGRLQRGGRVLLVGSGAGMSLGGAILRY